MIPVNSDIQDRIEKIAEQAEESTDFSDLTSDLEFLKENPLNLNFATRSDLDRFVFLDEIQKFNLIAYRENFGHFVTLYELGSVEGFDAETIAKLLPFVYVSNEKPKFGLKPAEILKSGRNECLLRYQRTLERQEGYTPIEDSDLYANPDSRYLGSPDKYYVKYRFTYFDKVRFGFAAEKDAGEPFLKSSVNDSLQKLTGSGLKNGFDFYSFHLNVSEIGILKTLSLGDYQLGFGQGLTIWSGLAFGTSATASEIKRFGRGIKPASSANESYYFRGAAATFSIKKLEFSAFYSGHKADARIYGADSVESTGTYIESVRETGLHRTPSEIQDKNSIATRLIGGNLSYFGNRFNIGFTSFYSKLSRNLYPDSQLYNQFDFSGSENINAGADYSFLISKVGFFGEISFSRNGGFAQLHGFTARLHPSVSLSLLYRNYQKNYQNYFSNAFGQASGSANEKGMYCGININLRNGWILSAFADTYRFPWLKYQTDAPSLGNEYLVRLQHNFSMSTIMYFQFRQKNRQSNVAGSESGISPLTQVNSGSFRIHFDYGISPVFTLRSRIEYIISREGDYYKGTGYLAYQDIAWKSPSDHVSLTFRYALFHTDSYNERIYSYEPDILYAFSIPAYYYQGSRLCLLAHASILQNLKLWLRLARTIYYDREFISSGLDQIDTNHKTEIKAQLIYKF
jgi:hypothetical protein